MKKKVACLCILASFLACSKKQTDRLNTGNSDEQIQRVFSRIGTLHNRGIDYLYGKLNIKEKLGTTNSRSTISDDTYVIDVNQAVNGFLLETLALPDISLLPYFRDSIIVNPNCTDATFYQYVIDSVSFVPSITLKTAINAIFATIESGYIVTDTSNSQFDQIQVTFFGQLENDIEKMALVAACSVSEESSLYWEDNLDIITFGTRTNYSANLTQRDNNAVDPWKVVKADCRGAIVGVVRGAFTGAAAGTVIPGIGTVSGATAGGIIGMAKGMVVSSGASAIWQKVKGWFS